MRVCAYCRVSTDRDDQANSFENQKQYFEKFINQHPEWNLIEIYADEGVTGTSTKKRTNFNRMIRDAKRGKIDLILTKEVTRFARNTVDTLQYTRELKSIDVRVIFLIDNIDTFDSDGEFRLTIMASIAQEESRKTSERVKWGMSQQMKRGFVCSPDLLGYDVSKGKIFVNKEEAELVRKIFYRFAYENKTAYSIAKEFEMQGIQPRKRMKTWSSTAILRILRNEKYVGDLLQGKYYVKNFLDHKSYINTNPDTMYFFENHHEPIIDRETWDIVQSKLSQRSSIETPENKRLKASNKYWCSGKIQCGLCGYKFSIKGKKLKDGTPFNGWKCTQRIKYGTKKINKIGKELGCNNNQINQKALEHCVLYAYDTLMKDYPIMIDNFKNELKIKETLSGNNTSDIKQLKKKKESLEKKKQKIIDMFVDGLLTREEFEKTKNKYINDLVSINEKIVSLEQFGDKKAVLDNRISKIYERIDEIISLKQYKNNMFFEKLVERIIAYPNKIQIYFNHVPFPLDVVFHSEGRGDNYTTYCSCNYK